MDKYVVKDANGTLYARRVNSNDGVPIVEAWTPCQRCAVPFSRDRAHEVAHQGNRSLRVFRVIPRGK